MAERIQCPKCRCCDVTARYSSGVEWWRVAHVAESIQCRCQKCGYRWEEETADSQREEKPHASP